jgi:hypothetical protein
MSLRPPRDGSISDDEADALAREAALIWLC